MKREAFEHLIRAAGAVSGQDGVIVVGSQSVLGVWDDTALPDAATRSIELDARPVRSDPVASDLLEANLGFGSQFHITNGYYIDVIDESTAILPGGWETRIERFTSAATNGYAAYCIHPTDACAAKLMAGREKDFEFVAALIDSEKVDARVLQARLAACGGVEHAALRDRALAWLRAVYLDSGAPEEP